MEHDEIAVLDSFFPDINCLVYCSQNAFASAIDKNIVQSLTEAITTILEHEYEWQQKIAAGKKEICKQYSEEAFYQRFINCIENENRNPHIR